MLAQTGWPASQHPLAFVCRPTSCVEAIAENLTGLGYPPGPVNAERFGGT
jgi:ferredoxin-NADP reductase